MNARYPTLTAKMLAMSARFARKYDLDIDDVRQELEIIKIEFAGCYDAGRGATRETYYLNKLEKRCLQMRAEQRFGVALDDQETDAAEALVAGAVAGAEIAQWRLHSDVDVDERAGLLPAHLRPFAQRFLAGLSCKQVAKELGLTPRRARQVAAEIVVFFGVCVTGAQPSLF